METRRRAAQTRSIVLFNTAHRSATASHDSHNKARQTVPDALLLRWRWELVANGWVRAETLSWLKNGHLGRWYGIQRSSATRRNVQNFWAVNRPRLQFSTAIHSCRMS